MIFHIDSDNEPNELIRRMVSESGLVEIGVYKVLFGFRIRSGFIGSSFCNIDWCGGNDWNDIEKLYRIAISILSQREENTACFEGIPEFSTVKPFYNDLGFTWKICSLAGKLVELPFDKFGSIWYEAHRLSKNLQVK